MYKKSKKCKCGCEKYMKMTVKQLRARAAKKGIKVPSNILKSNLAKLVK